MKLMTQLFQLNLLQFTFETNWLNLRLLLQCSAKHSTSLFKNNL